MHSTVLTWLSLVGVGLLMAVCPWGEACSPPIGPVPPDTAQSRVHYADVVAYGQVIQHYTDSRAPFDSFTAEMSISCVFKGAPVPQTVNITNAGVLGGMCFATTLSIAKSYVVFLRRDPVDVYSPTESDIEVTGLNDPYIANVTRVCDLFTQYPKGVNEFTASQQCPQTDQTPNCVRHEPPVRDISPPPVPGEILPPGQTDATTTTEIVPPLKDFTGPDVKVDTQKADGASGNLEQQPNGTQPTGFNGILVLAVLTAVVALVR